MSFLSLGYFLFFPLVALVYFLLPQRGRNPWLLVASWFFYLCAKPIYLVFLLFAICSTYLTARLLEGTRRRGLLVVGLALNLGLLVVFKYLNFALSLAARALGAVGLSFSAPALDLLLPVGISFYLFTAMGYLIDVYRGKRPAERSFLLYALFVSFFPPLLSGPISRAEQLLPQFQQPHAFCYDKLRAGLLRFLWGAFQKLLVADRLAVLVNTVYKTPGDFGALQLIAAAVAFSLQIYCDFSAYSHMALGCAKMMGFTLMENFRTPYFARSISAFWRAWHISLSSWFRDYLYIPLGGSRKGTLRKYLNLLIVFAVSGLWHGAALTFLVWGLLNGVYQVIGGVTAPLRAKVRGALHLRDASPLTALFQICITFALTTIAWVFFKAGSLGSALALLGGMVSAPLWQGSVAAMGLGWGELLAGAFGVLTVFFVDLASMRHDVERAILSASRPIRWLAFWFLFFSVVLLGSYGAGYDAQSFIYFQF